MTSYFQCSERLTNGPPPNGPKSEEEALARIDELYNSNVPWFSKKTIRSALEQIQRRPARGDKIFVKAVDGTMVEYDIETGDVRDMRWADGPHTQWILQEPTLAYRCRANMRHDIFRGGFNEDRGYLNSIRIMHRSLERRKDNNELIDVLSRLPLEEATSDFEKHRQAWNETEMCKNVTRILDSSTTHLNITKIVAVSLGCLSWRRTDDKDDDSNRSAYQHALILTLRDWLKAKKNADKIPCYVQDPVYTDIDRALLAEHEVEVLNDPMAWLEINDFSIVVSIASNVPTKEIITDIASPAVIIWNEVGDDDYDEKDGMAMTDPCSSRVRALIEGYDCFDWGASDEQFGDVLMYVRRPKTLCREL
ncbi:hypothetical protein N7520_011087 [Penicillium odoratum]|uniref:uncharacterized protein n=1 Tax=Penicillium odoratum TaxID=1167516 RepID=UPI002546D000|nr:uncharacterized protein N7520_011087 [Penicillium odoratum]KAJ5745905.1 hypothetical protein N7520_011087 [Penicillium odoratum]